MPSSFVPFKGIVKLSNAKYQQLLANNEIDPDKLYITPDLLPGEIQDLEDLIAATYLPLAGGTITGNLGVTGNIIDAKITNSATTATPLIVNSIASTTARFQDWTLNNNLIATIANNGRFASNQGISNLDTINNSTVVTSGSGTIISRNIDDANPSLKVNLVNTGSNTLNIAEFQQAGTNKLWISKTGKLTNLSGFELAKTGDATVGDFSINDVTYAPTIFFGRLSPTSGDNTTFKFRGRTGIEKMQLDMGAAGQINARFENTGGGSFNVQRINAANTVLATFLSVKESDGNVGIGTDSPLSSLSVVTGSNTSGMQIRRNSTTTNDYARLSMLVSTSNQVDSTAEIRAVRTNRAVSGDTDLSFFTNSNSTLGQRMVIRDDGNVGIGTTAPNSKLSVITASNTDGIQVRRNSTSTDDYSSIGFRTNNTEGGNFAEVRGVRTNRVAGGDTDLRFATWSNGTLSEKMSIRDDGRVGIGTNTPGTRLNIAEASEVGLRLDSGIYTGFLGLAGTSGRWATNTVAGDLVLRAETGSLLFSNGITERFRITAGGNLGVATATPNFKVDVAGDVRIRESNALKLGGTGAADVKANIRYDATSDSIEFSFA
jgi:hypothetical protein